MSVTASHVEQKHAMCRIAVIWIDWYAYHLARFKGLQSAIGSDGEVRGIELVGGVGVHKGYNFRVGMPEGLPVETLRPRDSWHETGKLSLAILVFRRLSVLNPAVVLIPGYYTLPAIAAALWCKWKQRTSVLMTETTATDHVRTGWRETLKSRLIRTLFDWAVTGGKAHDRYLLQLGFPQNRIAHFYDVVGNAYIRDGVAEARAQTTAESHSLPADYFLFVGRLSQEKNVLGLLSSWLTYRDAGGAWSLLLAGDGPDGTALRQLASSSAYAADVHFLGHKGARELLPVYAFAKCFVLPSTREPWGLVVNEAMAASLPVIVSDRCGCAEDLVEHGGNGYVFDPADARQLTACLTAVSALTPEARLRQGERSLQRIAIFSPQNFGQEVAAIADAATGVVSGESKRAAGFSEVSRGNA
jgi:1,2-diacylglycerol 3-alpha-glucosyltransferase